MNYTQLNSQNRLSVEEKYRYKTLNQKAKTEIESNALKSSVT